MRILLHKIQRSEPFIIRTDNLNRIDIALRHIDCHIYNAFNSYNYGLQYTGSFHSGHKPLHYPPLHGTLAQASSR